MKTLEDVKAKHDYLRAVLLYDRDCGGNQIPQETVDRMMAVMNALAWVIGNECGVIFERSFERLEARLTAAGFRVKEFRTVQE